MGFFTGDEPQNVIAYDLVIFALISSFPVPVWNLLSHPKLPVSSSQVKLNISHVLWKTKS